LVFDALTGATGSCTPTANSNAQWLFTVNKDTLIGYGATNLLSVNYNGLSESGTVLLSSFLYAQKVIEFAAFPNSNSVVFNFAGLPAQHEKVIVRARVRT
jgi:hypothetical protein